eukprot:TRINITY_DN34014_c0_g1_i1.p1 TRINITY_DN34014_c0_g1~~TRINITY_DN34014_c0_g1_i1.p1  ORF type:complete len:383 (+),score=86.54 TRINITY_DN34014_c0_g1_i1:100-1149(+)
MPLRAPTPLEGNGQLHTPPAALRPLAPKAAARPRSWFFSVDAANNNKGPAPCRAPADNAERSTSLWAAQQPQPMVNTLVLPAAPAVSAPAARPLPSPRPRSPKPTRPARQAAGDPTGSSVGGTVSPASTGESVGDCVRDSVGDPVPEPPPPGPPPRFAWQQGAPPPRRSPPRPRQPGPQPGPQPGVQGAAGPPRRRAKTPPPPPDAASSFADPEALTSEGAQLPPSASPSVSLDNDPDAEVLWRFFCKGYRSAVRSSAAAQAGAAERRGDDGGWMGAGSLRERRRARQRLRQAALFRSEAGLLAAERELVELGAEEIVVDFLHECFPGVPRRALWRRRAELYRRLAAPG